MVQSHKNVNACITVLTSSKSNPTGMGRIIRNSNGELSAIVEESEADEDFSFGESTDSQTEKIRGKIINLDKVPELESPQMDEYVVFIDELKKILEQY